MAVSQDFLAFLSSYGLLKIRLRGDIREISDSAQANTAWSFAGINFVFEVLKGMQNKNRSIGVLHKPKPPFFVSFLMVRFFRAKNSNITAKTTF